MEAFEHNASFKAELVSHLIKDLTFLKDPITVDLLLISGLAAQVYGLSPQFIL
jgi:hypothetical protein